MSERLVILGIILVAASGVPGLLLRRRSMIGQQVTTLLAVIGAAIGLSGVGVFWMTGDSQPIVWPWSIPGGEFHVAVGGLSAVFLMPIFLMSLMGNIYGLEYWKQTEHSDNGRRLRLFYGLLTAGMALLVIARNGILFLFGWEIMAISAFFLVTTEEHLVEARTAGWIYLVATHVATMALMALIGLLRAVSGSYTLAPLPEEALTPAMTTAIFVLILFGFGIKAGLMPLHVWLPSAHAIAPSHVSAMMSGVIIKMGIFGIISFTSLIPHPPVEWGGILLCLGAISGVLGVAFAIGQHDLKRLLAYHSIENIGIIVMGIGLALIGRSLGRQEWIVLGFGGALLHVWNHALFKGLLFLSAGSVIHAVHTREIDRLGGLSKRMPRTAFCFLVGSVAICGLPPLNGFVSEFLIYLGLFDTAGIEGRQSHMGTAIAAPVLALIGALALACFVKVFGAVFLGNARSAPAQQAHESGLLMIGPMSVLVACCFFIGLAPTWIAPFIERGIVAGAPELGEHSQRLTTLAPLGTISVMALALIGLLALFGLLLRKQLRSHVLETGPTWGCGYAAATSRMQYTSSSFAEMLVGLFAGVLRPRIHRPENQGLFPQRADFHSDVPDTVLRALLPTFRFVAWLLSWCRIFQQGNIHFYLLYIFLALLVLLLWR